MWALDLLLDTQSTFDLTEKCKSLKKCPNASSVKHL